MPGDLGLTRQDVKRRGSEQNLQRETLRNTVKSKHCEFMQILSDKEPNLAGHPGRRGWLLQVDTGFQFLLNALVAQMVKRLPAVRETQVRSLGWEDPLEKEMATHSSTLVWRIPWTEEPGRLYSPRGHQELDTTERLDFNTL